MPFNKGESGNPSGRPKGSRNKTPDREKLIELLNLITEDLTENYDKLNINQKIRILQHFNGLYKDEEEQGIEPRVFNIIRTDDKLKEAFGI